MKKVIIIGATSGIGLELAKLFIGDKWLVGATGRRTALLESLQTAFSSSIITECFDVTGNDNIKHLENLISRLDGLDILIYNSGYGDPSESLDWEIDKQTTLTNVNGFLEITNYAFNYFVKQGHGQIVGISSIASITGGSYAPAYNASKAYMSTYLLGLQAKTCRNKLDIAVTDIQPGFVKTKMAKGHGQFWVAPVEKASRQIYDAIMKKKARAYITKRWWLIAKLLRLIPYSLLKRII